MSGGIGDVLVIGFAYAVGKVVGMIVIRANPRASIAGQLAITGIAIGILAVGCAFFGGAP